MFDGSYGAAEVPPGATDGEHLPRRPGADLGRREVLAELIAKHGAHAGAGQAPGPGTRLLDHHVGRARGVEDQRAARRRARAARGQARRDEPGARRGAALLRDARLPPGARRDTAAHGVLVAARPGDDARDARSAEEAPGHAAHHRDHRADDLPARPRARGGAGALRAPPLLRARRGAARGSGRADGPAAHERAVDPRDGRRRSLPARHADHDAHRPQEHRARPHPAGGGSAQHARHRLPESSPRSTPPSRPNGPSGRRTRPCAGCSRGLCEALFPSEGPDANVGVTTRVARARGRGPRAPERRRAVGNRGWRKPAAHAA